MTRFFRAAPLTPVALVTTTVFIGAFVYFGVKATLPLIDGKFPDTFDLLAGVLLALVIGYAWLRSVRGYSLAENEVIIDRAGPGKLHIAVGNVKSVEIQPDLGTFVKSNPLSTQGLFGWAGNVEIRKPTDVQSLRAQVYGTNPANAVVLQLANGRTVIVTPKDTAGFEDALHQAGVASPSPLEVPIGHYKQGPRKKRG